jgi:hypothetical protein
MMPFVDCVAASSYGDVRFKQCRFVRGSDPNTPPQLEQNFEPNASLGLPHFEKYFSHPSDSQWPKWSRQALAAIISGAVGFLTQLNFDLSWAQDVIEDIAYNQEQIDKWDDEDMERTAGAVIFTEDDWPARGDE